MGNEKEKNLHYISRTLLRNFLPNGKDKLYVLERPDIENLRGIKDVASEFDYNVLTVNGEKNYELEETLGKIETPIGRILKKINSDDFDLSPFEWEQLLTYGAAFFCNSPNTRDKRFRTNSQIMNRISKIKSKTDAHVDEKILKDFSTLKDNLIYNGIRQIIPTYLILSKMHWAFYILKDESIYITSDIPIIPLNKDQSQIFCLGFEYAGIVQFPLTKKVCLVGNWFGPDSNKEVTGEYANGVNAMVIRWAFKEIYSPLSFAGLNEQFRKYG